MEGEEESQVEKEVEQENTTSHGHSHGHRDRDKMDKKERARERREKRRQEISLLRTIPYSDHQKYHAFLYTCPINSRVLRGADLRIIFSVGGERHQVNLWKIHSYNFKIYDSISIFL